MQQVHHQRTFPNRPVSLGQKFVWAGQAVLVTAAFVFVAAVTLGLFP
jgi:hypothetical protein